MRSYVDPTIHNTGFVEFKAYYRYKKQMHVMHEFSAFNKIDGRWFYVGTKK